MWIVLKTFVVLSVARAAFVDREEEWESLEDAHSMHWGYGEENGPEHWHEMSPACGGFRQSPVNIVPEDTTHVSSNDAFAFYNFDVVPERSNLTNNGHTASLKLSGLGNPNAVCGFLPGEYEFGKLHFHWGRHGGEGSEHLLNGNAFPMEMHLVFFKREYGSVKRAIIHPYGVAVLGVWFVETDGPSPPAYQDLILALKDIRKYHASTAAAREHPLFDYLPIDMNSFFRYTGSLTTPPCTEHVIWTVFEHPVPINSYDLDEFRTLENSHGHRIGKPARPVQKLNDRHIHRYVVNDDVTPLHFLDKDDFMYRGLFRPYCPILSVAKPYQRQTLNYLK